MPGCSSKPSAVVCRSGGVITPAVFVHPEVGPLELHCQRLVHPDHGRTLLVCTAAAGSESAERLRLLSVIAVPVRRSPRAVGDVS